MLRGEPLLFLKPNTSVIGPGDAIVRPPQSHQVDVEGELALVIGSIARSVSEADAASVVFGYTVANDVTARDLQSQTNSGRAPRDSIPSARLVLLSRRSPWSATRRSRRG